MGISLTCTYLPAVADEAVESAVESAAEDTDQAADDTADEAAEGEEAQPEEEEETFDEAETSAITDDDDEAGLEETQVADDEDGTDDKKDESKKKKDEEDADAVDADGLIIDEDLDPHLEEDPIFSLEELWMEGMIYSFPGFEVDPSKYPAANVNVNTVKLYRFLKEELKLNHAAACGLLANVQMESNFRPLALGDGGTSYGFCQWHNGRFTHLMNYCKNRDLDYNTLEGQLSFLGYELTHGYRGVYEALLDITDDEQGAYDAAYLFCMNFEKPNQTEARSMLRGNLAKVEYYDQDFEQIEWKLIHKDKLLKKNWMKKLRKKYGSLWDADFATPDENEPDYEDQILPEWNSAMGEPEVPIEM